MATSYLQRTVGTPTNAQKYTYSFWVKRCELSDGVKEAFLLDGYADGSNRAKIAFQSGDQLEIWNKDGGSNTFALNPPRKFRDVSAFYHIVLSVDTTQATASDRVKLYINGVQETNLGSTTYPSQNDANNTINESGTTFSIMAYGGNASSNDFRLSSILSHVHFTDGYAYGADSFGSTDSVTGQWKINTSPSITMGNNGFTILKDGNTITDQSSNSNDFTLGGGQLTNLKDNPSNNFCNINTLYNQTTGQGVVVNNCGNTVYYASNASRSCFGSIAPSSGKYYFEAKVFGGTGTVVIGIVNMAWSNLNGASGYAFHDDALNFGYNVSGQKTSGGSNTAYGSAISDGDIVGVAMDLDNSKLYFSLNGVFQGSGDPTSGASGTNAAFTLASGANYTAACRLRNGTQVGFNFGNGQYSGSSVVASEGTNASGNGKFEYDVPTGYTALSTKGLNL